MEKQTENLRINGNSSDDEMEIDLLELLYYYQSKLLWIIGAFVIGALVAGLITRYGITPKYTATSKVYMVSSSSDSVVDLTDLNIGTSLSTDYVEMIQVRPIYEAVISEQKLSYTYEELLGMTKISTIDDTRIMTISVTSPNPEEAMNVSNALADKAVSELPELMETSEPHVAEYAVLPEHRSSPSYTKNTLVGGVGLMAIVVIAFTIAFIRDDTLKSSDDVENAFGILPLTVIPESDIGVLSEVLEKKEIRKRFLNRRKKTRENSGK